MSRSARALLALACWTAAAAAGWWWHRPPALATPAVPVSANDVSPAPDPRLHSPQAMAARVAAADPLGLKSAAPATMGLPGTPGPGTAPGAESTWRLAALVVRDNESYAVLTSGSQVPLRLHVGDLLPDGDRIKSIQPGHIEIQSPRGLRRTLYLIEP
ncbi:MAG: hypothetical protein KGN16_03215 [Burkholderiales bacterium]|nr:hypothetical protein [Burkholderiales bacterium]